MRGHIPPSQAASLALSALQYVDSGNSFSNLGSSGEDLSVRLGTLVLIHLHNTKKLCLFLCGVEISGPLNEPASLASLWHLSLHVGPHDEG